MTHKDSPDKKTSAAPAPAKEAKKEPAKEGGVQPLAERIGFARLDLTVEEVEERISPRETNVFDK